MKNIIIGASGLIGSNLYTLCKLKDREVIGTYNHKKKKNLIQYDMRTQALNEVIPDISQDDTSFLLSAYSNPRWIYDNQDEAINLNLYSTKKLIDEISEIGSRIIFMSSVEVFDGKYGSYNEESVPQPLNLYGRMKYEIEKYLFEKIWRSCIVRTGWNVGWNVHHRCVIKLTYDTLMQPNARMANDNTFSISDVRDTAEGLLRICDNDSLRICHLASAPYLVRNELASSIKSFSKYGDILNYKITSFSKIPYSEPRARYNHIDNSLAVSLLGMKFRFPEEIIREKVELLDSELMDIGKND